MEPSFAQGGGHGPAGGSAGGGGSSSVGGGHGVGGAADETMVDSSKSCSTNNKSMSQFCIGEIEPELHKAFANMRTPYSRDYVYGEPEDLFQNLDEFCDPASMHYQCPPLVVCGPSGVGKSALLSNWYHRRFTNRRKHSNNDDVATHKEFIFWHVAGCSRISCQMSHMLRRLLSELRAHFDLTREVSKDEGRLRWDLPTFLEMAARKGRVILMIDGIHRMRDADGEEDLKWLPLKYPGNVRLIVSTTVYPELMDEEGLMREEAEKKSLKRNKSLVELKRRGWDMLEVKELSNKARKEILTSYFKLTYEKAHANPHLPHLGGGHSLHEDSGAGNVTTSSGPTTGLILFPSHYKTILSSPAATNPLFLRVLLNALHWSASKGLDLWTIFNDWSQADSIYELYERILNTWESGLTVTSANAEEAERNIMKEGGYGAVLRKHPWLQQEDASTVSSFHSREGGAAGERGAAQEGEEEDMDDAPVPVVDELPLAEMQWRQAHSDADKAIAKARAGAEKASMEVLQKAAVLANRQSAGPAATGGGQLQTQQYRNEKMVEYLISQKGEVHLDASPRTPLDSARSKRSDLSAVYEGGEGAFEAADHNEAGPGGATRNSSSGSKGGGGSVSSQQQHQGGLSSLEDVSLPPGSSSSGSHGSKKVAGSNSSTTSSRITILDVPGPAADDEGGVGYAGANLESSDDTRTRAGSAGTKSMTGRDQHVIPKYFRGGETIEGFGSVLGNALAVLYVARHGLTATELTKLLIKLRESSDRKLCGAMWKQREILTDMFKELDTSACGLLDVHDIRAVILRLDPKLKASKLDRLVKMSGAVDPQDDQLVNFEKLIEYCGTIFRADQPTEVKGADGASEGAPLDDLKGLSGSVDGHSQGTLGDTMEQSLLAVLIALGVMHSPQDKVLVLTLESEALREVVRRRYVKNDEGEERWHNAIMKYFQAQPSSLRRCEELPWHLHICRRWTALKDALSDLWAFEIMYRGKLKNEFFEYWRILTEGPLYVAEDYEMAVKVLATTQTSVILSELDTATVLNFSDQRAARERLRGQMATFDMIDCYNQAIEHWRAQVRPSTHALARMLELIACFMAEFAEVVKFEKTTPKFLRKPLVYDSMHMIGVEEAKYLPLREKSAAANAAPTAIKDGPYRDLTPEQLAMLKDNGGYYYFKRWIWVQFPWMALANTELALRLYGESLLVAVEPSASQDLTVAAAAAGAGGAIGNRAPLAKAARLLPDPTTTFRRMWEVKKLDPHKAKKPTAQTTDSIQFKTMVKACVAHMAPSAEKADRMISSALADKVGLSVRLATKTFDPTPKASDHGLPLSGSSLRALKHGTRVPSVEKLLKQALKEQSEKMDLITATAIHRFGGQREPKTVKEMMEAIESSASICAVPCMGSIGAHSYALPITIREKDYMDSRNRVASLRGVLDRVRAEKSIIQAKLVHLLREASERESQDLITVEKMETGEIVIEALQERLMRMNAAVMEAESLGKFYRLVLSQIGRNPAKDVQRLECLDQQVVLSTVQLRDLTRERQLVYLEKEKIEKEELRKAQLTLDQVTRDRDKARMRLTMLKKKPSSAMSSMAGISGGGGGGGGASAGSNANNNSTGNLPAADNANSVTGGFGAGLRDALEARPVTAGGGGVAGGAGRNVKGAGVAGAAAASAAEAQRPPLEEGRSLKSLLSNNNAKDSETLRSCMEKLFELAGTEEVSVVIEKIVNSQRLGEGLMEQCRDYENNVSELKVELSKMEKKLQDVNVDVGNNADSGNTSTSGSGSVGVSASGGGNNNSSNSNSSGGSESHNMEDSHFKEELRCIKARRAMLTAHQFLDQVKTGVNHLARLVARYSINLPLAALRSPDGLHEEKYDDAEVIKVLALFEERITAMKESVALEMNEKMEGATATVSSTRMLQTAMATSSNRDDELNSHLLKKKGAGQGGTTTDVVPHKPDPNLLGIDVDIVMHLKREKQDMGRDKGGAPVSLISTVPKNLTTKAKLLKHATDRQRVRIKATGLLDSVYDTSVQEVMKKRDEATERLEAEAEHKTVESIEGTENFIRSALSCKESQHELRRTAIRELEVGARQYPENDEGMGISLEEALIDTNIYLGRLTMLGGGESSKMTPHHTSSKAGAGASAASAEKKMGASSPSKGGPRNVVVTRDDMKALSSAWVARKTKAGKGKGGAGDGGGSGGAGDENRSEGTTLPPARAS